MQHTVFYHASMGCLAAVTLQYNIALVHLIHGIHLYTMYKLK